MALDLKLSIGTTEDCKSLVIQDVTGVYNEDINPGGWGDFNISGNRGDYNFQIYLRIYHMIEEEQYTTSINLPNFENLVNYPAEDSYRGFKVSIPAYDISTEIANVSEIPESYDPMQEVLEDTLYEIVVNINSVEYNQEFIIPFKNLCNATLAVEKMLGTINLECKDCDDSDVENALLAKSLLETLKSMN